ncbi:hypothetical protein HYX18_03320 [Candidatus Woesearchaeota archaeon]|nr:hypothetical protein [Candidatus Woesearchaeota archaeon]
MVESGFNRIIAIILGILVLIAVVFVLLNINKLANYNPFKSVTDNTQTNDDAKNEFSRFKDILNNCISKQSNDCFCTKEKIIFPTDYRLEIKNDGNFKAQINLLSNTKQRLDSINLQVEACNLIKKVNNENIDNTLSLHYASKYEIEFKRKKYEFLPDYTFYKKNNKICIVDKEMANNLDKDSLC